MTHPITAFVARASIAAFLATGSPAADAGSPVQSGTVMIDSDGWALTGTFRPAPAGGTGIAALLLHRAAGRRQEYDALAEALKERGIASLALDLRGHGDSVNLGRFEEPYAEHLYINQGAYRDVGSALAWLAGREDVDPARLAVVAASYSGEAAAAAYRNGGTPAAAYVMLSPGNFSDESILAAEGSGSRWLFVRSADESPVAKPHIDTLFEALERIGPSLERRTLDGAGHASALFDGRPALAGDLAAWILAAATGRDAD